jgi:hypothetical protein
VSGTELVDELLERAGLDGLDEMVVEAGGVGEAPILFFAPTREGNDNRSLKGRLLSDAATDFVAVHSGHAYVKQDELRLEL